MAKHYYNMELVSPVFLEEEDIIELETSVLHAFVSAIGSANARVSMEYVDSEG